MREAKENTPLVDGRVAEPGVTICGCCCKLRDKRYVIAVLMGVIVLSQMTKEYYGAASSNSLTPMSRSLHDTRLITHSGTFLMAGSIFLLGIALFGGLSRTLRGWLLLATAWLEPQPWQLRTKNSDAAFSGKSSQTSLC